MFTYYLFCHVVYLPFLDAKSLNFPFPYESLVAQWLTDVRLWRQTKTSDPVVMSSNSLSNPRERYSPFNFVLSTQVLIGDL